MYDNLGEFSEGDKVVMVGGNIPLSSKGKGMVRLNCALPDGSYHQVVLQNAGKSAI